MATLSGIAVLLLATDAAVGQALPFGWHVVFLTFGLIVLAAWLYRWLSILYLLPGLLLFELLVSPASAEPGDTLRLALHVTLAAPFAFATMDWAGINTHVSGKGTPRAWRIILLAGIKASIFGLVLRSMLDALPWLQAPRIAGVAAVITWQMVGLLLFMMALLLLLRASRSHGA